MGFKTLTIHDRMILYCAMFSFVALGLSIGQILGIHSQYGLTPVDKIDYPHLIGAIFALASIYYVVFYVLKIGNNDNNEDKGEDPLC